MVSVLEVCTQVAAMVRVEFLNGMEMGGWSRNGDPTRFVDIETRGARQCEAEWRELYREEEDADRDRFMGNLKKEFLKI